MVCVIMDCSALPSGIPMVLFKILCAIANWFFCNPLILGILIILFVAYKLYKQWKKS
jgi:hypothetical protein